jgi:hypothetical protein
MDHQEYAVFGYSAKKYGLYRQEIDGKLILGNASYS